MAKLGAENIQNTLNVIKLPQGLHRKISAYYSSIQSFTGGKTVRQWLSTKSFQEQYKFGIKKLKDLAPYNVRKGAIRRWIRMKLLKILLTPL
jgi:hypothetical protein